MYTIYADGKLLYAPHLVHQGCGVFSPKLTVELNKAGSLEFVLPPSNTLYNDISKLKTIITAYQNEEELFRGRVLHDEKDFYKQKQTYCEGELAFLLDSKQRPYYFSGKLSDLFKQYISNHNARVDLFKRFSVGEITIEDYSATIENPRYTTTHDEIFAQLVDIDGGYLKTRGVGDTRYIDWLASSGSTNTQTIEFGVNLLDITEYITAEDVFTVVIPVGAELYDDEGYSLGPITIETVNNGKDYVEDETAIALFGRIEHTEDFTEVLDPDELKELGEVLLAQNIKMSITLTVKAVDLYLLDVDVERIRVGDWVRVISLPHKLDEYFQCTKIVYDMVNPEQSEYTFGYAQASLTDRQVNDTKTVKSTASVVKIATGNANASANKANQAATKAETVIAQMETDYVKTVAFEAHKTESTTRFGEIDASIDDILTRLSNLEGGTN